MSWGQVLNTAGSVLIALIAVWSARSTQRNAAAANQQVARDTSRAQSETEAYTRARALDIATIDRLQAREEELEADNAELERELAAARTENELLRRALAHAVHDDEEDQP